MSTVLYVIDLTGKGCANPFYYTHPTYVSDHLFKILAETVCEMYDPYDYEIIDAKLCESVGFKKYRCPPSMSLQVIVQKFDEAYLFAPGVGLRNLKQEFRDDSM